MDEKAAKTIVEEMSPKVFLSGLEGLIRSGNYESIEFKITCHKKRTSEKGKRKTAKQQIKGGNYENRGNTTRRSK